jgi:hypothetical protein
MLHSHEYDVRAACFALIGLMFVKCSVCYNWIFELMEEKHHKFANSIINTWDGTNGLFIGAFFYFVKPEWFPIMFFFVYLGIFCFIVQITLLPESPKFLLRQGRKKEAIDALNRIGWLNMSSHKFYLTDSFAEEIVPQSTDNP